MEYIIGLDIGGTKISVILGDSEGNILKKIKFFTPTTFEESFELIVEHTHTLIDNADIRPSAIGVSCGGPLNPEKGTIESPPNLPTWDTIPIVKLLYDTFKIPTFLENDANACCIAEWKWGAGKQFRNIVFLTFGTGLGAGLMFDGKIYHGSTFLSGEVGHIRMEQEGVTAYGKIGSAESFCSGAGISRLATYYGLPEHISAHEVFNLAKEGNEIAQRTIHASAVQLGKLLAIIIDLLNPDCIIIGSIYARQESFFYPIVQDIISKEALPASVSHCKILPSELGEKIGDVASLGVALHATHVEMK